MPVRTRTVMVQARGRNTPILPPCPGCGGRTRKGPGRRIAAPGPKAPALVAVAPVQGGLEVADLALGAVLLPAIALLQLAGQVLGIALGHVEHVVGEVAPLGLHLALQLLPVAGDDVAVHACSLLGGRDPAVAGLGPASPVARFP